MKFLFWLSVLVVAAALALFAASNRGLVALACWPLPFVVELPLYLPIVLTLLVGFIAGAFSAWVGGWRRRREARRRSRRIAALERELAATQAALPGGGATDSLPAPLPVRG